MGIAGCAGSPLRTFTRLALRKNASAPITDALVQLRLIAHIENRSRSEVGSSRVAAQSAALAEEASVLTTASAKPQRAAEATRVAFKLVGRGRSQSTQRTRRHKKSPSVGHSKTVT